jgi:antitoxin component YwqK of YwqJK toxin-antitoxin module
MRKALVALLLSGGALSHAAGQLDTLLLALDEHYVMGDSGEDPSPDLDHYDRYNASIGGDSIRLCGGHPCTGWVQDDYLSGQVKHRGYYDNGRLSVYKNFHANGQLEREFKASDELNSQMRTWHANGSLRSVARYREGVVVGYEDHYVTGALRYAEERMRHEPCFTKLELYAADGKPISLLRMIDRRKLILDQQEFYPGGRLKCQGRARFDRSSLQCQRIGTWAYFDPEGKKVREEDFIDGKVHAVR